MLDHNRLVEASESLAKSKDYIEVSDDNLKMSHYNTVNTTDYYAIFHAISSIVLLVGKEFRSHGQLLGYFNKEFILIGGGSDG
jgi:uncharacterized protein (UPF0332 family)